MKPDTRAKIIKKLQDMEMDIMETKAREYANNSDTLANFKTIAKLLNHAMPLEDGLRESLLAMRKELCGIDEWASYIPKKDRVFMGEFVESMSKLIDDALNGLGGWAPQHVLAVYFMKHILAILDNMNRGESLSESMESRVLDARVYAACGLCLEEEKADADSLL